MAGVLPGESALSRPLMCSILLASTMLAGVPAAYAQSEGGSQAASGGGGIEEVIVTAEKRSENMQRVAVSIQAFDSKKLDELHLTDFNSYVRYLPSVTYTVGGAGGGNGGPGFANVYMRGVVSGNDGNHSGSLPSVGVYLDEEPITTIGGTLDIHIYDIERVEALAGPQGTLYGASSQAGTLRIITNKPNPDGFEASYSAEVNTVEDGGIGYTVNGMVNIPLDDRIAVRIVAWNEHDAGFIDNVRGTRTFPSSGITVDNVKLVNSDINQVNKIGARAALQIDLNENWTVTPTVMFQNERSDGIFGFDPSVGDLQVNEFFPEFVHDNWYQAGLTVQGKIANLDLVYSGSYLQRRIGGQSDYTAYAFWYDTLLGYGAYFTDSSGNLIDPSQFIRQKDIFTKQSHELRVSTPQDSRLRGVAGVFYERQTHDILQRYQVLGINPAISIPNWPDTIWLTDQTRVDRDAAFFTDVSFDILPNLTLTGGVRVFTYRNSLQGFFGFGDGFSSQTGVSQCFTPVSTKFKSLPCLNLQKSVNETGTTRKVNLKYQVTDDKMVYFTYSTGFRPGGINRRSTIPPYTSDTLTNYEVGWKTSWYDNRVRFNAAFYWEEWDDFQFSFLGQNSFTEIHNAGSANIKGIETDITWLPIDGLTLTAAGAYNDAKLTSDFCGPVVNGVVVTQCPGPLDPNPPQSPAGTQLPITPKYKVNGTARYEFEVGDALVHLQSAVAYQSASQPDLRIFERSLLGRQPEFTTVDFSAGVDRDNWSAELFVANATDKRAQLYRYANCTTAICGNEPSVLVNPPRTIGFRFSQRF